MRPSGQVALLLPVFLQFVGTCGSGHAKISNDMERVVRLDSFWSWLPAFRVVAETAHLPTAARTLGVGPSALSRSVRLLESRLGSALFERRNRRLVLTGAGEQFLVATRDAMRRVDDGVEALRDPKPHGPLRVAAVAAAAAPLVLPAVQEVVRRWPGLAPDLLAVDARAQSRLLTGDVDLAIVHAADPAAGVDVVRLGELARSVWCGRRHPLVRRRRLQAADLAKSAFVVPTAGAGAAVADGWPTTWPRHVAMRVEQLRIGAEVCAAGELLAVLPDHFAEHAAPRLHRLPLSGLLPVPLLAVRRTKLSVGVDAVAAVIAAIRRRLVR